jgi:putative molybdopterin biosynthesis protein
MGVASAVLTEIADTGLAILASAKALGLDFIPVARERYDLAIPHSLLETEMFRSLLYIIREDNELKDTVMKLGGYDISDMGKVMFEG